MDGRLAAGPRSNAGARAPRASARGPWRGKTFWFLLCRLTKGTRRKGETVSRHTRSNGYAPHQNQPPTPRNKRSNISPTTLLQRYDVAPIVPPRNPIRERPWPVEYRNASTIKPSLQSLFAPAIEGHDGDARDTFWCTAVLPPASLSAFHRAIPPNRQKGDCSEKRSCTDD